MKVLVLKEFGDFEVGEILHFEMTPAWDGMIKPFFFFSEDGERYYHITIQEYMTRELSGYLETIL